MSSFSLPYPSTTSPCRRPSWGGDTAPTSLGWFRVGRRPLDTETFVAKVVGHSMRPGILDDSWGLFRSFSGGGLPSATTLDERRVVVHLPTTMDPETGAYTFKRWRVTSVGSGGAPSEIALRPDNKAFKSIVVNPNDTGVRVVAEYLETVG